MARPVVLITGCGGGFGLLSAVAAARAGFTVYAGVRDLRRADALRAASAGLPVHALQLDVTDDAQRRAAVQAVLAAEGRIDGLVNNAGRALAGFLELVGEDELRALYAVNVFAVHALTAAVLPTMRAQGRGVIVNVSSVAGRLAVPGLGAYASSKFALEGMSEAWRHELAPFGIRVVLLEPGPFKTDMLDRNRGEARRAREDGPYAARTARLEALAGQVNARAEDPAAVAARVVGILQGRRRALRQPIGRTAALRSAMARFLPFAVIEALVGRILPGAPQALGERARNTQ